MSSPADSSSPPSPWSPTTDPTGFDVVESLYRGDGAGRTSGVRPFVPALRPPEGVDGYGWLYRSTEAVSPLPEPAAAAPTTGGLAVLDPVAAAAWSAAGPGSPRRWPVVLLLTVALVCTALVALLAAGSL